MDVKPSQIRESPSQLPGKASQVAGSPAQAAKRRRKWPETRRKSADGHRRWPKARRRSVATRRRWAERRRSQKNRHRRPRAGILLRPFVGPDQNWPRERHFRPRKSFIVLPARNVSAAGIGQWTPDLRARSIGKLETFSCVRGFPRGAENRTRGACAPRSTSVFGFKASYPPVAPVTRNRSRGIAGLWRR